MTRPIAVEVARREKKLAERVTGALDLAASLLELVQAETTLRFPNPRCWEDPVWFFRTVLGVEPWHKQVEIIEAIRDHKRVAVKSGHKVSKSHTAAGIALCFYSSFPDARVVMSSTTARQVDQILWRELRMMRARSGRCTECKKADPEGRGPLPCPHSGLIHGEIGELARTGLKSEDFREVVGFTAREAEAVAGISGAKLLYLLDEASGIPNEIFEAIEGNRAGGARLVMFSNPTRTEGEFFDAFNEKSEFYHCITVSSEETPNVVSGKDLIPGLAGREWIEEKRAEWGEDSPLYKVRVKGEFATNEDGKIFSIHAIGESQARWSETELSEQDRLFIGLDPAGPSGTGDDSAFALRRGKKIFRLLTMLGLNEDAHLIHLLSLIKSYGVEREVPVVVMDREGSVGAAVFSTLRIFLENQRTPPFQLVAVRASDAAQREPHLYDRMRDELTAQFERWVRDGGAVPEDSKLAKEMHLWTWEQMERGGRFKLHPRKKDAKKHLGRSPDRYDACVLSVHEPMILQEKPRPKKELETEYDDGPSGGLDPYGAERTWR